MDFIWFNKIFLIKIVDFFVGNEPFRLLDKLVDRLIEIIIVVSGSPRLEVHCVQWIQLIFNNSNCSAI